MKRLSKNNSPVPVRKLLSQLVKVIKPKIEFYTIPGNCFRGILINVIENRMFHLKNLDMVIMDTVEVISSNHIEETMIDIDKIESVDAIVFWW